MRSPWLPARLMIMQDPSLLIDINPAVMGNVPGRWFNFSSVVFEQQKLSAFQNSEPETRGERRCCSFRLRARCYNKKKIVALGTWEREALWHWDGVLSMALDVLLCFFSCLSPTIHFFFAFWFFATLVGKLPIILKEFRRSFFNSNIAEFDQFLWKHKNIPTVFRKMGQECGFQGARKTTHWLKQSLMDKKNICLCLLYLRGLHKTILDSWRNRICGGLLL